MRSWHQINDKCPHSVHTVLGQPAVCQADATALCSHASKCQEAVKIISLSFPFKIMPTFFDLLLPVNKTSVGWRRERP